MTAASRQPGRRTTHTVSVTLRLTDHQGDYGALTLSADVAVLWGHPAYRIGSDRYNPGVPDEVQFIRLPQPIAPTTLAHALDRAVRSYVTDNGEQCVRLVEHAL